MIRRYAGALLFGCALFGGSMSSAWAETADATGADSPQVDSVRAAQAFPNSGRAPSRGALLTEVGIHTTISNPSGGVDRAYVTIDAGYLARTSRRTLVGGEVSLSVHDDGSFWAILPRVRRELDRNWWLDVAAGPIVSATAQSHNLDGFGISAYTVLSYRGYIGVTFGVQSLNYSPVGVYFADPAQGGYSGRVTTTYIGARVGKRPGMVAMLGLGFLGFVAVASLSR